MKFLVALLAAILPLAAVAADVTVSWEAPTTYIDSLGATGPLPAGTLNYQVWGAIDPAPLKQITTTSTTSKLVTNLTPGKNCFAVTDTFVPTVPDGNTWGQSPKSDPVMCVTIAPQGGPRAPGSPQRVTVKVG